MCRKIQYKAPLVQSALPAREALPAPMEHKEKAARVDSQDLKGHLVSRVASV